MDPESEAAALSGRQTLEEEYRAAVEPEVEAFLSDVQQAALVGALSAVAVMSLWRATLGRLERKGVSPELVESLSISPIADEALTAAQQAMSAATGLGLAGAAREALIRERMGVDAGHLGSLESLEGRFSWRGSSEAAIRTSATADFATSMLDQMRAEGYTHKRWMTRYDARVRETHVWADRQTVPIDDTFTVGGESLRYPGDPMGSTGETINCRCVLVAVRYGRNERDLPEGETPWNNPRPA